MSIIMRDNSQWVKESKDRYVHKHTLWEEADGEINYTEPVLQDNEFDEFMSQDEHEVIDANMGSEYVTLKTAS